MTSPLISVLSPSSTGPMPVGAAAAGHPSQPEGPSFSSVLGNQQAQRQANSTAQSSGAPQNSGNNPASNAASGAGQQASPQASAPAQAPGNANEASAEQATAQAGQQASDGQAQGQAGQSAQASDTTASEPATVADAGTDTNLAADAAGMHALALAGAAAISAGQDTRQAGDTRPAPEATRAAGTTAASGLPALPSGPAPAAQLASQAQGGRADALPTRVSAQASAARETSGASLRSPTEAVTQTTARPAGLAAANDATGMAIAAATNGRAGSAGLAQANSQATVLRRAEPLTPARAAILEGARRAVEAAHARSAQHDATQGSQKTTSTAEFLDMLAYARSVPAAAASANAGGAETATGTAAFMPATPAVAGPLPSQAPVVSTPLGSPYWGGEFGRQVVSMARGLEAGSQVIELRLDPPDLGPIRISLSLSDNVAQAAFVSPHAVVRQTVENALPQLQQLLADAGISLGNTSVSDQNQPGQQAGQGNSNGNSSGAGNGSGSGVANGDTLAAGAAAPRSAANPNALVDTFA